MNSCYKGDSQVTSYAFGPLSLAMIRALLCIDLPFKQNRKE